jgi:hypothetical protein
MQHLNHVDTVNTAARAVRNDTRRRLREPRPAATPEVRARIGLWKAQVKAARLAGNISEVDPSWADELLTFPSVAGGGWCMASDATFGRRLNVKAITARRRRRRLDSAGLIEVQGHGKDGNSCLVRPILRDGTPVFGGSEMTTRPITSDQPPRSHVNTNLFLTEVLITEPPPLPPEPAAPPEEGGKEGGQSMKEGAPVARQEPAQAPGPAAAPTQPPTAKIAPAGSAVTPAGGRVPFEELWRLNPSGFVGRARAAWLTLSDAQTRAAKADLEAVLKRGPLPKGFDYAGTHLKMIRAGQPAAAIMAPAPVIITAQFYTRPDSAEWAAWEKYYRARGLKMPEAKGTGLFFDTKLPPWEEADDRQARADAEARKAARSTGAPK